MSSQAPLHMAAAFLAIGSAALLAVAPAAMAQAETQTIRLGHVNLSFWISGSMSMV